MQNYIVLHNSVAGTNQVTPNQTDEINVFYKIKNHVLTIQYDLSNMLDSENIQNIDRSSLIHKDNLNTDIHYRKNFLWESTCFELFIKPKCTEIKDYLELNIAPSGYWNVYHFDYYRTPNLMPPRQANIAPVLSIYNTQSPIKENNKQANEKFTLNSANTSPFNINIDIDFAVIKQFFDNSTESAQQHWLVNMTAVIGLKQNKISDQEKTNSVMKNPCSYYANQHAQPADFHNTKFWYELVT